MDCWYWSYVIANIRAMSYENQNAAFIVNHSDAYTMAAIASWVEFWIEYYIFGKIKLQYTFIAIGLTLILAGQVSALPTSVINLGYIIHISMLFLRKYPYPCYATSSNAIAKIFFETMAQFKQVPVRNQQYSSFISGSPCGLLQCGLADGTLATSSWRRKQNNTRSSLRAYTREYRIIIISSLSNV